MSNAVKIYDTTLRDGTQGEGISFSVTDKLLIAQKLDHFGVDYIEGGFPGSNPRDITFFQEAQKLKLKHAPSVRRAAPGPRQTTTHNCGPCWRVACPCSRSWERPGRCT